MKRHETIKTPKGISKPIYVIHIISYYVFTVIEKLINNIRDFYWKKAGIQAMEL